MKRPDAVRLAALVGLVAVVVIGLVVFQVRVRLAGLKYLLLLGGVLLVAWWIGKRWR